MMPLQMPHGFEVKDVEGEAAIPVDVFTTDDTPSPTPPQNPPSEPATQEKEIAPGASIASPDAAPPRDAGVADAQVDGHPAAQVDAETDAQVDGHSDAQVDGLSPGDGAIALMDDAAVSSTGPRDPEAIVGAVGSVQADVIYVILVVNAEVIRSHSVGAHMGYLLRGVPQWDEFINGTDIDPVRDTDWVMVTGPSLVNTSRDVVLVHYSASDAVIDRAVDVLSHKYDRGGRIDAGVPGVRASLAHADRADRVILRAQSHVLALVPPNIAQKEARKLASARVPAHLPERMAGDAVYLRLVDPHHPMPEIPDSVTELRMRVVPRADGGADVFIDGDTKDAGTASDAAVAVRRMVRRHDDALTSLLTHGLLDHVEVRSEGNVVKLHLTATRDQVETLVSLVGDFLGVQPDSPPAAAPPRPAAAQPRSMQPVSPRSSR